RLGGVGVVGQVPVVVVDDDRDAVAAEDPARVDDGAGADRTDRGAGRQGQVDALVDGAPARAEAGGGDGAGHGVDPVGGLGGPALLLLLVLPLVGLVGLLGLFPLLLVLLLLLVLRVVRLGGLARARRGSARARLGRRR